MSEDEIETAAQPDEVEELVEDPIEVLETRVAELLSDLQYARAETINARHRGQRDKAEVIRFGSAGLAVRILPAIDGLEKALANGDGDSEAILSGVRLTLDAMRAALTAEGISRV